MGVRLTLGELKDLLIDYLKDKEISEGASILWGEMVEEGSRFQTECGGIPGSLLLGIEYIKDGSIVRGTLMFSPPKLSDKVS